MIETGGMKYEIYEDVTNITIETDCGVRMKQSTEELRLNADDPNDYYEVMEVS